MSRGLRFWIISVVVAGFVGSSVPALPGILEGLPGRSAGESGVPGLHSPPPVEPITVPKGDFSQPPDGKGAIELPPDPLRPGKVVARTPQSTTFDNGDGTSTVHVHQGLVNWPDKQGVWRGFDPRLKRRPDGNYENTSAPVRISVAAATGSRDVVAFEGDGWSVGYRPLGMAAGVVRCGNSQCIRRRELVPPLERETQLKNTIVEPPQTWVTVTEATKFSAVSRAVIDSACKQGRLSFREQGGRRVVPLELVLLRLTGQDIQRLRVRVEEASSMDGAPAAVREWAEAMRATMFPVLDRLEAAERRAALAEAQLEILRAQIATAQESRDE